MSEVITETRDGTTITTTKVVTNSDSTITYTSTREVSLGDRATDPGDFLKALRTNAVRAELGVVSGRNEARLAGGDLYLADKQLKPEAVLENTGLSLEDNIRLFQSDTLESRFDMKPLGKTASIDDGRLLTVYMLMPDGSLINMYSTSVREGDLEHGYAGFGRGATTSIEVTGYNTGYAGLVAGTMYGIPGTMAVALYDAATGKVSVAEASTSTIRDAVIGKSVGAIVAGVVHMTGLTGTAAIAATVGISGVAYAAFNEYTQVESGFDKNYGPGGEMQPDGSFAPARSWGQGAVDTLKEIVSFGMWDTKTYNYTSTDYSTSKDGSTTKTVTDFNGNVVHTSTMAPDGSMTDYTGYTDDTISFSDYNDATGDYSSTYMETDGTKYEVKGNAHSGEQVSTKTDSKGNITEDYSGLNDIHPDNRGYDFTKYTDIAGPSAMFHMTAYESIKSAISTAYDNVSHAVTDFATTKYNYQADLARMGVNPDKSGTYNTTEGYEKGGVSGFHAASQANRNRSNNSDSDSDNSGSDSDSD